MIPIDKVKKILDKYISLEKELSTGKIDPKLLAKKSKEYSDLKDIIPCAKAYIEFEKNNAQGPYKILVRMDFPQIVQELISLPILWISG